MLNLRKKVLLCALYSRFIIILISFLSNLIIPDHSADAFVSPLIQQHQASQTIGDRLVNLIFGGLVRWDAQYFLHIAAYGYTYENTVAFFPLYPLLLRFISGFFKWSFGNFITFYSALLLSSVIINIYCFVKAAVTLYDLGLEVTKSKELSYKSAILFCVNPASIFFVAAYSESLFAYLTFYGLLKCSCASHGKFSIVSGICFGLSAATRSNGILNIGFIVYCCLKDVLHMKHFEEILKCKNVMISVILLICKLVPYVISLILSAIPFIAFQLYCYHKFCFISDNNLPDFIVKQANSEKFILIGSSPSTWCNDTIPLSYSYVQHTYWNVGFLRYYQWKQIPNFILASPILILILSETFHFLFYNKRYWKETISDIFRKKIEKSAQKTYSYMPNLFVFAVHALFLTIFCLLCIHIQVSTRLITSANPVIYWFSGYYFLSPPNSKDKFKKDLINSHNMKYHKASYFIEEKDIETAENMESNWRVFLISNNVGTFHSKTIKYFFLMYVVIGTIMFSNFLPWT